MQHRASPLWALPQSGDRGDHGGEAHDISSQCGELTTLTLALGDKKERTGEMTGERRSERGRRPLSKLYSPPLLFYI